MKDLIINKEKDVEEFKYDNQDSWGFQPADNFFKEKN